MNTTTLLQLNVVPEGKTAWLTFDQYQELKNLFEAVSPFSPEIDTSAFRLHRFLTDMADLDVPMNIEAIHFNAFVLLRRGYKVEEITEKEYQDLLRLMDGLERPDPDDMELHEAGGHRNLYNYLTIQMGISVPKGRGPVWYRAKGLVEANSVA
ncbi:MAG: hypothetical protein HUU38_13715 [Anaerolineales bacterium]|nr:hypothetical protein [Anaerolineales bacterium]